MVCIKCGIDKHEDCFEDRKSKNTTFKRTSCKECQSLYLKEYYKTKDGLISKIYSHQKQNSKKRGHSKPIYSKVELKEWLYSQPKFHAIYNNWVESGYKNDLIPSVDRKDDYKGYSFDNIQVTQLWINIYKSRKDRKNGINNKGNKAVDKLDMQDNFICEYFSMSEAQRDTGAKVGHISECCNGIRKQVKGFKWRYSNVS